MSQSTRITNQIQQLEAKLKEARAKAARQNRQERNGQLVSLGILFERHWKSLTPNEKADWTHRAFELDERNRGRVQAAFLRMSSGSPAEAVKPEEESQKNTPGKFGSAGQIAPEGALTGF